MKIVILITLLFLNACTDYEKYNSEAIGIGSYFIETTLSGDILAKSPNSHPKIVRVGNKLKEKLIELKPELSDQCKSTLSENNADSKASHVIFLVCDSEPLIGIRLKWENNKFHILGWWTSGL
jgi:hypothetical protein